jgi:hypothetical protein
LVHKLRSGTSIKALDRQLKVEASTMAGGQSAAAGDPIVSVGPNGVITVSGTGSTGTNVNSTLGLANTVGVPNILGSTGSLGVAPTLPGGLTNSVVGSFNTTGLPMVTISGVGTPSITPVISQLPVGTTFSAPTSTGLSLSATSTGGSINLGNGTSSLTTLLPSATTGIAGVSSSTSGLATGTTGSVTTSPLGSLLTTGTVPTPGLNTTTTGTTGATPVSMLTFTPATVTTSPINPSPLPFNGTLPFTGTPANPSPVPVTGILG